MKWGEYSNDIQFILRRSDPGNSQKPPPPANNSKSPIGNGFVTFWYPFLIKIFFHSLCIIFKLHKTGPFPAFNSFDGAYPTMPAGQSPLDIINYQFFCQIYQIHEGKKLAWVMFLLAHNQWGKMLACNFKVPRNKMTHTLKILSYRFEF